MTGTARDPTDPGIDAEGLPQIHGGLGQTLLQAHDALRKALTPYGLEQIVHRGVVEGIQRVALIGRGEHDLGGIGGAGHFQAGEARHADIKEGDVRLLAGQCLKSRQTVGAFTHYLKFRPQLAEQLTQPAPLRRLILSHQSAGPTHAASS